MDSRRLTVEPRVPLQDTTTTALMCDETENWSPCSAPDDCGEVEVECCSAAAATTTDLDLLATAATGTMTAVETIRRAFPDPTLLNDRRVLDALLTMDDKHLPSGTYFKFTQRDLKPYMRRMVVTWMLEVCTEQQCEDEVFPMAVNYMDRVLSTTPVRRSQLQLLASVCMFVASKFKDTTPLNAHSLVIYTDRSISLDDLLEWELLVLQALKWDVSCVTPHDFLEHILTRLPLTVDERLAVRNHAMTFIALCTADFKFVVSPPSMIAAACVSAATTGLKGDAWCSAVNLHGLLRDITSTDTDCIRQCQEQIEESLRSSLNETASSSSSSSSTSGQSADHGSAKSRPDAAAANNQPSTPTDVREINLN